MDGRRVERQKIVYDYYVNDDLTEQEIGLQYSDDIAVEIRVPIPFESDSYEYHFSTVENMYLFLNDPENNYILEDIKEIKVRRKGLLEIMDKYK